MEDVLVASIINAIMGLVEPGKVQAVKTVITSVVSKFEVTIKEQEQSDFLDNRDLLQKFLDAKSIEGCSEKTKAYYRKTLEGMIKAVEKPLITVDTDDLRKYLSEYQSKNGSSKVTIDNIRRIISSFFSWLEEEDHIVKSPARRIHKIKTDKIVKEVYTDEELEKMRDSTNSIQDLALIDMLASTGMRVGELVKLDKGDIDFQNRECIVFGKGNKERKVYFDARAKIHLEEYLESRTDENDALFVSLRQPHSRITINGVESRLKTIGDRLGVKKVHPHKFRRTLATAAIDKGMPVEQLQRLLGHERIDTTMQYAMVKQSNVKDSHRRYIG